MIYLEFSAELGVPVQQCMDRIFLESLMKPPRSSKLRCVTAT